MAMYLQSVFFFITYLVLHYQITDPTLRKRFALTFLVTGLTLTFLLPYVAVILRMPFLPVFGEVGGEVHGGGTQEWVRGMVVLQAVFVAGDEEGQAYQEYEDR